MEIKKALTFRASSIGDCLMGKYLLENIHAQYSDARLGIVVANRGAMISDLFAAYPWLEIIEVNRRSPRALWYLWKHFHGSDLIVTQYAGKKGGRFAFASKLVARLLAKRGGLIGFTDASRWNGMLYDRLVPVRSDIAVVEHDREALRAAGLPVAFTYPTVQFVENHAVLNKFALGSGECVVVHLFAGNKKRGLHPDKKRELLLALAQKLPHTRLLITGGANDRAEALRVSEHIAATVVAGEVSLQETMNLIKKSKLVVSVDTGVAHIAAQLGTPLVIMRTCVGRNWWLPGQYGSAAIKVFSRDEVCTLGHDYGGYAQCLGAIDVEEVASQTKGVFHSV